MSEIDEIIESTNLKTFDILDINPLYRIGDYVGLTPPEIAIAYNMPASTGAGVKVGIIAPLGGGFLQSDLDKTFDDLKYSGLIASGTAAPTINQVLLDGTSGTFTGYGADMENTLDIYAIATLVPAANITIYFSGSFVTAINRAVSDGCHVLSISYTYSIGEPSSSTIAAVETALSTASAAKVAICVSSGDSGSTFTGLSTVKVAYPSSSPNVISVGGTKLILNSNKTRQTETDDNRDLDFSASWGGGGGISGYFSLPSWQSGLYYTPINSSTTGSPTALTMRGLPDISGPMNGHLCYFNGSIVSVGGTSASAPVMAGMLTRIQALTGNQRSSAEYNTLFYKHKTSFYDIIVGSNNTLITSGYVGTTDWDPVTGLGPPVGNSVYQYLKNGLRPILGKIFPNTKFDRRPTSGQMWPRTKTL